MATAARLNDLDFSTVASLVDAINEDPQNAATVWQADVRWRGGFRSEASIRGFEPVPSDEPEGLAGSNTAPNPVEQVAAALGNCLAVGYVAQLTARGIAVNALEIGVSGELDLRPFLGLAPGHAGYSRLDVSVRIDADTDAETLQLVHEQVVATSPVGHTLANPVPVDVQLVA
jgi:uncharacterized OsmC-like protein